MVKQGNRLEEEIFDLVRSEEAVLGKVAEVVGEFLPVEVPAVSEAVEGILDFTAEAVKAQRAFARRMLKKTHSEVGLPFRPKAADPARRPATKRVAQTPPGPSGRRPATSVRAAAQASGLPVVSGIAT